MSAHSRNENKRGRGGSSRGRGGNRRENIKTKFEDQAESNDPDEIRRQVEFYFSDSNLPIDAYLLSMVDGQKNRPVDLHILHNFKRMRHFQPYSAVLKAVQQSKVLDVTDEGEITRKTPIDARFTDDAEKNKALLHTVSMPRSIYAKGFGQEGESTAFDIENFFAPYGVAKSVRLRRSQDGVFKGSVFVEFEDEQTQKDFLALDPKPQWNGKDLEIMGKQEYVDMKNEGILEGTVRPRSQDGRNHNTGRRERNGDRGGNRNGGDRNGGDRKFGGSRECFNCGKEGHISRDCEEPKKNGGRPRRDDGEGVDKDDWNKRRDRDNRNGGRGGRGGRGRGRGRDNRNGGRGRSRSPDGRNAGTGANRDEPAESKKRSRDADGEADGQGESKKVKEAAVAEA